MKHSLSSIKTLAAAQSLLGGRPDQSPPLEEVLELVGRRLEVDRVSLFKLSTDGVLLEPLALWGGEGIARRDPTPLAVDAIEDIDSGVGQVLAAPIYHDARFTGMLLAETSQPHKAFDPEAREFARNAAVMLAPHLDSATNTPPPPKLNRPVGDRPSGTSDELNVLIVEDDEANLFMMQKFIERFGAIPHAARNGQDAIQICKEMKFDVILMDLTMPKLDGFDATREIVTGANLNRNTPIIAVTADVTDGIERRCKKIGMQHYIAKPIRRDTIIRALTDLTNKKPEQN